MQAADVRSLYFADLETRYTKRKQMITGLSFFLSSGAAATMVAHLPPYVPVLLAACSAVITAYSIAVGLDRKAATMAKLHYTWAQIETDRKRLWNRWFDDDAEIRLKEIEAREADASQSAVTEAPYNEDLLLKWRQFVDKQYAPASV